MFSQYQIKLLTTFFMIRWWPTVCNFAKKQILLQICSRSLLKLSKLLFCRGRLWWLLLLLDKSSRYYEHFIKQTTPRQFSILINDSHLREINLHETSKRTVQACSPWDSLFTLEMVIFLFLATKFWYYVLTLISMYIILFT